VTPLALFTLLGFGAVIVLALAVWSLLMPRRAPNEHPASERPGSERAERRRARSNDEVRGAKARSEARERPAGEDAFERFLRAGRDDPK
jgi:hypothetical protein